VTSHLDRTYVALGSNLGNREAHLALGRLRLSTLRRTHLVAASSIEETDPLGPVPQGPYLNQMVLLDTALEPLELLERCRAIEVEAGRERRERWGPRTLDLDIVRFGDRAIITTELTVPHPELPNRDFWQREIGELDALAPAHV
jgi:2-amino-4-hydroxy-6-hydroxymethyldihydropteridine diphosphokinase